MSQKQSHVHVKLGEFFSTAICGNDILSSALYVSGIASIFAGIYAPIVLLAVALVLFFYKSVYREVVEALPVNGGAYNALLNGTSKTVAAIAGVMTILSYIATAVISAKTAVEYLFKFLEELFHKNGERFLIPAIIIILFFFALLVISGVKDSAKVAAGIFSFHIFTLVCFVLIGIVFILANRLSININLEATQLIINNNGGLATTLFIAFSASLLGVSGFESSANFVEEQKKGVFKKTLRNMALGVAIFNPLIAFIVLNILPITDIAHAKDFLLAEVAIHIGGLILLGWIAIDAFMVLCGAVLTSYVGVSGLVNRMAMDDCLPNILLKENKAGSHPRIIVTFFVLCTSILLITKGDLLSLAGVYTISFLGVMSLFALGNLILRLTRRELKRSYKAPLLFVIIALFSTIAGLIGNSLIDHRNVIFFMMYFIPSLTLVLLIIYKKEVFKNLMPLFRNKVFRPIYNFVSNEYYKATRARFYVFIHHVERLHDLLEYIHKNENGWNITIIQCKDGDKKETYDIKRVLPVLKKAGVYPHFNINYEYIDKEFCPCVVDEYVAKHDILRNRIFIGSIHHHNGYDYDDFGGVRIVF